MLRWTGSPPRIEGFIFVPSLEAVFGIFLMIVAVAMPILFIRFNGLQVKQYPEWFFCLGFLAFFLWMGKTLAFQFFEAKYRDNRIFIRHNLRGPDLAFDCPLKEWSSVRLGEGRDDAGKSVKTLSMVATDGSTEVYRSVDMTEVEQLKVALEVMLKNKP